MNCFNKKRTTQKRGQRKNRQNPLPGIVTDNKKRVVTFKTGERTGFEVKYVDLSSPGVNIYDVGTVSLMNGCIQGLDSSADRIGRKITVKNIRVCGVAVNTVAQLGAANFVGGADAIKVAVVLDKQTNGAAPAYVDIFNTSGAINAPFGNQNISNVDRFVILYEALLVITATGANMAKFDFTLPCNIDTRYNTGNAGNSSDVVSGGIFITFSDMNNTATNQTAISWQSRVAFMDT